MLFSKIANQVLDLSCKKTKVPWHQQIAGAQASVGPEHTSTPISPNSHIARLLAASGREGLGDDEPAEVELDLFGLGEVRRRKPLFLTKKGAGFLVLSYTEL